MAAGRLAQTVGGKFSNFSENRKEPGLVKDATGLVGSVYTAGGQTAIDMAKENEAKEAKADQSKQAVAKQSAKPVVKPTTPAKKLVKKPVVLKEEAE